MNEKTRSALLVAAAGCMWGFMGLLVRRLGALGLGSIEICFLRALVTALVMGLMLLVTDRAALKIRLRDIWCFIGTGVVSFSFFTFCYFKTILLTSLSAAAVLLYTAPVFVVFMSAALFSERLTKSSVAAAFTAFLGCALVSGLVGGGAVRLSLSGILFGLGAGAGYALYSIFSRFALERGYSSKTISFYTFALAVVPTALFSDCGAALAAFASGTGAMLVSVLLILFVTLFPYLLYTRGLQGLETGAAAIIASIEPVVATLLGALLYGEALDLCGLLGVGLVLLSIVIINVRTCD